MIIDILRRFTEIFQLNFGLKQGLFPIDEQNTEQSTHIMSNVCVCYRVKGQSQWSDLVDAKGSKTFSKMMQNLLGCSSYIEFDYNQQLSFLNFVEHCRIYV